MSKDLKLVPLFGDNTDMRSKLFIDQLRDSADAVRAGGSYVPVTYNLQGTVVNKFGNVQLTAVTKGLQNRFFATPTPGRGDMDAHAEWDEYMCDLYLRIQGQALSADALKVVKDFAGSSQIGSEEEFAQAVIKSLVANLTGAGADINLASSWVNATGGTYHVPADLALNLIEPNIDQRTVGLARNPTRRGSNTVGSVSGSVSSLPMSGTILMPATATYDLSILNKGIKISPVDGLHEKLRNGCGRGAAASGKKEFTYRYDKYWLKTMLEAHATTATAPVAASRFWDDETPSTSEVYYRKGSELYTRDASGAEVRVDSGSPAFQKLAVNQKCLGTGYAGTAAGETCADYLRDCLSGKDVTKCKTYLADDKFWEKAVDEVEAMLPAMAVQTLNAFEFGMEQVWDNTAARRLYKYKSTDAWIAGLVEATKGRTSAMTVAEVEKIAKNTKLVGYLNMLVKKVNSNPAVLNKDYSGATDATRINNPDAFVGSRLHRMGVKARLTAPTLSVSSVDKLANGIKESNARIGITLGYPGLYGFSTKLNLMSGGGSLEDFEAKVSDVTKQTGHIIQNHFLALHARLQKHGKEIEKSDHDKILNLIDSLKKSEEKLYKATLYTEKYARLLEVHGQKDATSVLNMDHLRQFVDNRNKYFTRVSKKQNDLMSILRSIAEAANKEAPVTEAEMKAIDVDPKSVNFGALLG